MIKNTLCDSLMIRFSNHMGKWKEFPPAITVTYDGITRALQKRTVMCQLTSNDKNLTDTEINL